MDRWNNENTPAFNNTEASVSEKLQRIWKSFLFTFKHSIGQRICVVVFHHSDCALQNNWTMIVLVVGNVYCAP
jgi:hypothetical protein